MPSELSWISGLRKPLKNWGGKVPAALTGLVKRATLSLAHKGQSGHHELRKNRGKPSTGSWNGGLRLPESNDIGVAGIERLILLEGGLNSAGQMAEPDRRAIELAGGLDAPVGIIPAAAAADNNHERAGQTVCVGSSVWSS